MTTILRASGAAQLLSHIPVLTGFVPRHSIVLLPFCESRTIGALRFDAPDPASEDSDEIARFAATAVGTACRVPDTDALAIAFYLDEPLRAEAHDTPPRSALPLSDLADELMRRADACGLHLVEVLCVGPDGWSDYRDPARIVHPLADLPAPPSVPGIAEIGADQHSGAELPQVDLVEKERVGRALLALEQALSARSTHERVDPRAFAAVLAVDDLPVFFESVLDRPENLPPFSTAALLWALSRPLLRDVALVQWARDIDAGDRSLQAQLAFRGDPATIPSDLGEVLLGRGPRPDADRLGVALTIVRAAAARAPRAQRIGALTAAAWLSWARGQATHAAHYLKLADDIDPEFSFTRMLRVLVDGSVLPEWAFAAARPS